VFSEHNVYRDAFLPRDAIHSADYIVARCLSVRLSFRPSICLPVTRRYSVETAKYILKHFFHLRVATSF